jgi:hypothetical protein
MSLAHHRKRHRKGALAKLAGIMRRAGGTPLIPSVLTKTTARRRHHAAHARPGGKRARDMAHRNAGGRWSGY